MNYNKNPKREHTENTQDDYYPITSHSVQLAYEH